MPLTLGERIRELRLRMGRTQEELADNIATLSMITQLEENKALPSYKVLSQIADKLETTVGNLVGDSTQNLEVHTLYRIAKASMLTHDYEAAVNMYGELVKQEFGISKIQLMVEYAECLIAVSNPHQAVERLTESLESASEQDLLNHALMSHAHYILGRAYLKVSNPFRVYKHFSRALVEYSLDEDEDSFFVSGVYHALAELADQSFTPELQQTVDNVVRQMEQEGSHKQASKIRDSYQKYLNERSQRGD